MADEVFMDIPAVEKMAKSFDDFGQALDGVAKVLQGISITLKVSAFLTLGGSAAASAMIDRILPRLKKLSEKMIELSGDVDSAVKAYRDGDLSGSRRFV